MEEIPGQRPGTHLYIFNRHGWHMDVRARGQSRYICMQRSSKSACPAILKKNDNNEWLESRHNHLPSENLKETYLFKAEIRRRAADLGLSLAEVYDHLQRDFPNAFRRMKRTTLDAAIRRERHRQELTIPRELKYTDTENILQNTSFANSIYLGNVTGTDESHAIVFGCRKMIEALNQAREMHIDFNFQFLPTQPKARHLMTFYIRKPNCTVGYPVLMALCGAESKCLYSAILKFVIEQAPNLPQNLHTVVCDFDQQFILTLRVFFPLIRIRSCWLQLIKAVTRKWRQIMSGIDEDVLKMSWMIPVVPEHQITDAIDFVTEYARTLTNNYPMIVQFCQYLEEVWRKLPSVISVQGLPDLTANCAEAFTVRITARDEALNLLQYIKSLKTFHQEAIDSYFNDAADGGNDFQSIRFSFDIQDKNDLERAQKKLLNDRMNIEQFLRSGVKPRRFQTISQQLHSVTPQNYSDNVDFLWIETLQDPVDTPAPGVARIVLSCKPAKGKKIKRKMTISTEVVNKGNHQVEVIPPKQIKILSKMSNKTCKSEEVVGTSQKFLGQIASEMQEFISMPFCREEFIIDDYTIRCIICKNNRAENMYLPCNHLVLCSKCANHQKILSTEHEYAKNANSKRCVVCNFVYTDIKEIFYLDEPLNAPIAHDPEIIEQLPLQEFQDQPASSDSGICAHCTINKPQILIENCGHFCLCWTCAAVEQLITSQSNLQENFCPVCNQKYDTTIQPLVDQGKSLDLKNNILTFQIWQY